MTTAKSKLWRNYNERHQVYQPAASNSNDHYIHNYHLHGNQLVVDILNILLNSDSNYTFGISEADAIAAVQSQQPQLEAEFIRTVINDNVVAGYNFVRLRLAVTQTQTQTHSLIASEYRVVRVLDAFTTLGINHARIDVLIDTICANDFQAEAGELINDICKMTELHLLGGHDSPLTVAPVHDLLYYPDDTSDNTNNNVGNNSEVG